MNTAFDLLDDKYARLTALLKTMGHVLVALSGGVDSALLLQAAAAALGDRVLAVTVASPLTAQEEREDAAAIAERIGAAHLEVTIDDLADPVFVANPKDRCFHCKKRRFGLLTAMARDRGISVVVDGTNQDDFSDFRPGIRAAAELGVRSPLGEAGIGKAKIRELSRRLGLFTWDKPASACLASRIPYGDPITADKLRQIDAGERFVRHLGICRQVRLRHHGAVARLEVAAAAIDRFMEKAVRERISDHFKQLGFRFVALDLDGYSMGSLNREIDEGDDRPRWTFSSSEN